MGCLHFWIFILPRANIGGTWNTERRITGVWGRCGKFGFSLRQIFLPNNWWIKGSVAEWCMRNSLQSLTTFSLLSTGSLLTANPVHRVKDKVIRVPYPSQRIGLSVGNRALGRPFLISPPWVRLQQAISVEWVNIWTSWADTVLIGY